MLLRSYLFKNTCVRLYNGNFVTKTNTSSIYELPLSKHKLFSTSRHKHIRMKYNNRNAQTLEPVIEGLVVERGNLDGSRLWKPFFFTIGFSSASFVGAAIWQYENLRAKGRIPLYSSARWMQERTKKFDNEDKAKDNEGNRKQTAKSDSGSGETKKEGKWRNDFNRWWSRLSDAEQVYLPICLINILVFLAWRVPNFQPTMVKYFCSNPAASVLCWPMVLCTFSHYSALHLFTNMYVLHSFSTGTVLSMGREQFVGFYLAAGVISSFISSVHKVVVKRPGLSLGASGAIMAILGYMCTRFPDQELSIIFLPMFTFKAASAIKVIMGVDFVGMVMGWRFIDHAAHLGGALFGMFWSYWGSYYIWQKREPLLQLWHSARGPPQK